MAYVIILMLALGLQALLTTCTPCSNQKQQNIEVELDEKLVEEEMPHNDLEKRELIREFSEELREEREAHEAEFS